MENKINVYCLVIRSTNLVMMVEHILLFLLAVVSFVNGQHNLNQLPERSVIVNLFEWRFKEIALECEHWLGPKGFGAVQVGYGQFKIKDNCCLYIYMIIR